MSSKGPRYVEKPEVIRHPRAPCHHNASQMHDNSKTICDPRYEAAVQVMILSTFRQARHRSSNYNMPLLPLLVLHQFEAMFPEPWVTKEAVESWPQALAKDQKCSFKDFLLFLSCEFECQGDRAFRSDCPPAKTFELPTLIGCDFVFDAFQFILIDAVGGASGIDHAFSPGQIHKLVLRITDARF